MRVTVVGELAGESDRAVEVVASLDPVEVAVAVSRLGAATRILASLAYGATAEHSVFRLLAAGVILPPESFAPRPDIGAFDCDELVYVSAASLLAAESPLPALLERARHAGSTIVLDADVSTRVASVDTVRLRHILSLADVIRLTPEDADLLFPGRPLSDVPSRIFDVGVSMCVIDQAGRGALLATSGHATWCPHLPASGSVASSGREAFMAALLHCLLHVPCGSAGETELSWIGMRCVTAAALTRTDPGAESPTLAHLNHSLIARATAAAVRVPPDVRGRP